MNKYEKQSVDNAKHLAVLNSEMGETKDHVKEIAEEVSLIRVEMSCIKTDVDWMKRFFWIVASSSVGALVMGMLNFLKLN